MTEIRDLIVVIPVGPNERADDVLDTIDSVVRYTGRNRTIIVVDDSEKDTGAALQARVPDLDVIRTPRNQGTHGGLYLTLSQAYLHASGNYDFKVLLKLDADALLIGDRPEADAIDFFAHHPATGLIGLYGHGTAPDLDDHHWSKSRLRWETGRRNLLRDPRLWWSLRRVLREARANGFRPGDYILGGAYFMSAACVGRLARSGLLLRRELGRSKLEEDHLFGLLTKAAGLQLADFSAGELPMAMEWQRLPSAPEELVATKKKITHSVRCWQDRDEASIRQFFRERRKL